MYRCQVWVVGTAFVVFNAAGGRALAQESPWPVETAESNPGSQNVGSEQQSESPAEPADGSIEEVIAAPADSAATHGVDEMVVTALKRKESAQRIPAAITAVKGDALVAAGVNDATQLNKVVPAAQIRNNGGGGVALFVRGIGSTADTPLAVPANAFSIDQVFLSRPVGADAMLYDLERIEVLKGPQGTLYGRNATAGAVNIITRRPGRELGAYLTLETGSYWLKHATGAANIPIGDRLAIRFAGNIIDRDGYFKDGSGDVSTGAGRVRLLWEPSDNVSLLVSGDYAHQGGRGPAGIPRGPDLRKGNPAGIMIPGGEDRPGDLQTRWVGNDPWLGACSPEVRAYEQARVAAIGTTPGQRAALAARWQGANCDGHINNDIWGASADLEIDFDFATLSTIAAYRRTNTDTKFYQTPESQQTLAQSNQYSLESRLASKGDGKLKWLFGVFSLYEQQNVVANIQGFPAVSDALFPALSRIVATGPKLTDFGVAAFTQNSYAFVDTFRFTLGGRATHESKTANGSLKIFGYDPPDPESASLNEAIYRQASQVNQAEFSSIDFKTGVEWDVAPKSLLYANVGTGFHAGGLNPGAGQGPNKSVYPEERLTAYALGSKNRLFDGLLQINAEAYYWQFKNMQVVHLGSINSGAVNDPATPNADESSVLGLRTDSAGRAHVYGIDLDADYLLSDNDLLTLSVLWSESKYDEFNYTDFGNTVNAAGRRLGALPRIIATLSYQHTFQLGSAGTLTPSLRTRYQSGAWMYYTHTPGNWQQPYTQTDLVVTYATENEGLSIMAYVRNLEDGATILNGGFDSQSTGVPFVLLNPPRTFGVMVTGKL